MTDNTMTTTGTAATRSPTLLAGATPFSVASGYLDLWQREIDVARQFADAWTTALRWMSAVSAARWTGPGTRTTTTDRLHVDRADDTAAAPTVTVTAAALATGEAFDEAIHLLVDNDLSTTVLQRTGASAQPPTG